MGVYLLLVVHAGHHDLQFGVGVFFAHDVGRGKRNLMEGLLRLGELVGTVRVARRHPVLRPSVNLTN